MTAGEPLRASGQLRFGEYLRVTCWFLWRKFWHTLVLFAFAGIGYPILILSDFGSMRDAHPSVAVFYFIPGALTVFLLLTYLGCRRNWRHNKLVREFVEWRFSLAGIETSAALSSGRMSWEIIREARELGWCFLLFTSGNQVYLIPKRFFGDTETAIGFRELLAQALGTRAKVRTPA